MNKKRFLPYLFIFLLVPLPIKAQEPSIEPFPELNRETLLERFSSLIEGGATPQQAFENVAGFIIQRAKIGEKLTLDQGQSCYEVAGVNISLNYSINREGAPTLIRQEGVVKGFYTYEAISFYYDRHGVKGGKEFQEIYDMAVSVALKPSSPDNIVLSSDRTILCPEETATIKAELRCGECLMKMKEISFQWAGPGEVNPINTSTGKDGVAKTLFKAKDEGETKITAYYHDKFLGIKRADIGLKTEPCVWDVIISAEYDGSMEGRVHSYSCQAKIENIFIEWTWGLPRLRLLFYRGLGSIGKYKFAYFDGEKWNSGFPRGEVIWSLTILPKPEEIDSGEFKTLVFQFGQDRFEIEVVYQDGTREPLDFASIEPMEIPLEKFKEGKSFSMTFEQADTKAIFYFIPHKKPI